MRELIVGTLMINLFMFIIGLIIGVNPGLVTVSSPGGFVFQIQGASLVFALIAVPIVIALLGIRIVSTGLSDTSVTILNRCIVYFITWSILSPVTLTFLMTLPGVFGSIIYGSLTVLYAFGVFLSIAEIGGMTGGNISISSSTGGSE